MQPNTHKLCTMSNNNSWLGGFLSSSYSFVTGTNDSLPNDSTVNIESIGTLLRNLEDSIVPEQRKKTLANIKELSYSPATHKVMHTTCYYNKFRSLVIRLSLL